MEKVLDQALFDSLYFAWVSKTEHLSNIKQKLEDPDYRRIVDYGKVALPFIFAKITENGFFHWFVALEEITGLRFEPDLGHVNQNISGATNTKPDSARKEEIIAYWTDYGNQQGYI
jgi:hypothetical protein